MEDTDSKYFFFSLKSIVHYNCRESVYHNLETTKHQIRRNRNVSMGIKLINPGKNPREKTQSKGLCHLTRMASKVASSVIKYVKFLLFFLLLLTEIIHAFQTPGYLSSNVSKFYCSFASVNSSCAHPPPGNCRAFARIVSPGGRALAYPRATPGLLTHTRGFWLEIHTETIFSEKTSSLSLIQGLSVKDWTKLWRFLKVRSELMFPRFQAFSHCLSSYNTETWPRKIVLIMYFAFKTYATISREWGICSLLSSPSPGICHPKQKKVLMPGG